MLGKFDGLMQENERFQKLLCLPQLDFWQNTGRLDRPVDIMVSPTLQTSLKEALEGRGISYDVMIDDVQAVADSQMQRDVSLSAVSFDYTIYHTYAEVSIVPIDCTSHYYEPDLHLKNK